MNSTPIPTPDSSTAQAMDRRRYLRVVWFFARLFLAIIWWDLILRRIPGFGGIAQRTELERWRAQARRFRSLAVQMGGVLIKLGQFLSIRVDILPTEVTQELAGLQDEVPAETLADIQAVIAAEFGRPANQVFAWFAPEPQAAASLAQVHLARLPAPASTDDGEAGGGREVVVKVQRPRIRELVETDLAAIRLAIQWLKLYRQVARRVDLNLLFREFSTTTQAELNFVAEGRNAERFAADFSDDPGIRVPGVYWDYTTRCVLTLDNVASIKITDYVAIQAAGISRSDVARRLYDTYLKQIFVTNLVHADPHPGNLFVRPLPVPDGAPPGTPRPFQLTFVDFGMVATIPPRLRGALREYLIGIGTRDAHRVVQSYVDAGVLLPGADLKRLEALHELMFQRLAGVRMGQLRDIAFSEAEYVLHEYRDLIYEMPFQFPTDILFVGRAVGILSGIATGLDPEFDPWEATVPFAERLASDEFGRGLLGGLEEIGDLARLAVQLPARVDRFIRQAERGELVTQTSLAPDLARQARRLERSVDRLAWAVIFAGLLIAGTVLRAGGDDGRLPVLLLSGAGLAFLWGITRR